MRSVTCPCGTQFEPGNGKAKYCSGACRKRASRAGIRAKVKPAEKRTPTPAPLDAEVPTVVGAVIADLAAANALATPSGLAAVKLAQLIDGATLHSGSSPAAWVREMRSAVAEAKSGAPAAERDPIDEMEAKRRERRGA